MKDLGFESRAIYLKTALSSHFDVLTSSMLGLTGFSSNSETSVSGMTNEVKLIVSCPESGNKHMVKCRCPNSQSMFFTQVNVFIFNILF